MCISWIMVFKCFSSFLFSVPCYYRNKQTKLFTLSNVCDPESIIRKSLKNRGACGCDIVSVLSRKKERKKERGFQY